MFDILTHLSINHTLMKRNIMKAASVFSVIIIISIMACKKTSDEIIPKDPVPINLNATQVELVEAGNAFAFDIFRKVLENADESENIIISPLSISYALSMTLNGADGATRDAMLDALRVEGITPEEINNSCKYISETLLSIDKRVLMTIANSVWTENNFSVKRSFIDILTNYFKADSKQFSIEDPAAPGKINTWIEDKTNGLIKEMVDQLSDNTVMLLINAIYFKGKWKMQFMEGNTVQRPFYRPDGSEVTVPMMKQKEDFNVHSGNGFIIAEFPYGQGNFVMDIILPDNSSQLSGFIPSVTNESFSNWISMMRKTEVNLSMPRFKYGYKKQLKDILSDMGMGIAFTDAADFTNIAETPPLLINDVTHQAFIETNEEGTEAAAATIVEIGTTSVGPTPVLFNADHSFIYIIREVTTNSIIFMGKVADPLAD